MRTRCLMVGCMLVAVTACARHGDSSAKAEAPTAGMRREGLWRESVMRDGRSTPLGAMRVCIDAATDAKMTMIGHAVAGARCTRAVTPRADGSVRFHTICRFGRGGVIDSSGALSGDFSSTYRLHADSEVRGSVYPPLNGPHATDINATYVGPCPAGMSPGEIIIGPGFKVNLDRLPLAGAAAAFG